MSQQGVSNAQALRVGIVDKLPLYRAGVAKFLRASRFAETVEEGGTAADARRLAQGSSLDLLLLDPSIPGGGFPLVAILCALKTNTRLVILTSSQDAKTVSAVLSQGASGYILKDVEGVDLVAALRIVAGGGVFLSPSLGAQLFARPATPARQSPSAALFASLTPREKQILKVLSRGATNKEIARELKIAEATVKYFMTSIMQKIQVRNRVEAVLAARKSAPQAESGQPPSSIELPFAEDQLGMPLRAAE